MGTKLGAPWRLGHDVLVSRQDKIGRNQACPCGLGKKYKHCCGRLAKPMPSRPIPPELQEAMRRARDARQAQELLRAKQQGHGRPIISLESDGYRLVAIGNKLTWSKRWRFFTDFLLDYLKDQLGREWGERQSKAGLPHPVFRWLGRLGQAQRANGVAPGGVHVSDEVGCSINDRAFVYLINKGLRHSAIVPLSPEEIAAVAVHGDAIFGKPQGPNRNLEGDPLRLYDWFLDVYSGYPRDVLLRQMAEKYPGQNFDQASTKDLATRLARGYAAGAFQMQQARRRDASGASPP